MSAVLQRNVQVITSRAELLEAWLALTSVKYHDNLLILMLLNQWLALTVLRTTGPRTPRVVKTVKTWVTNVLGLDAELEYVM